MTQPIIARRLVFHLGGYEPLPPAATHRRFTREIGRFERAWSAKASVSEPDIGADEARWRIATSGPNWRVDTDYRFVRWDDILESADREPMWRRIPRGFLALFDFAGGALGGYFRQNWRYALFFLYPFLLFAALVAVAVLAGMLAAQALASGLAGVVAGALVLAKLLHWPARRLYLRLLFDDWIFARAYVRRGHPILDRKLDAAAREIVAADRAGEADEIVVIGHSLGAVLAVDIVDRALKLDPALGQGGRRLVLLSVGSSILKIGLHRAAKRFHAAVARVAAAPGVFWAEYQALTDVMNFFKVDPATAMGLSVPQPPVIRKVRIRKMLDPDYYRRVRYNLFRIHRQFVSGNDLRAPYDYFMLVCGPLPVERQVFSRDGAMSAIGADGTLLETSHEMEPAAPAAQARRA
jgi:hypothetical protein